MILIVSDNSPLNLLVRLGHSEILCQLFTQVMIPPEVAQEMSHAKAPKPVREFIASPPPWLSIRAPKHSLALPNLDPGESAAISLAVELHAILLVDERDGREAALAHGLQIIGAVGLLERAANVGLLKDLRQIHAQIRSLRFHVSDSVLSDSLARHLAVKESKPGS